MDIAHIGHVAVSGVRATTVSSTEIPAGMIGGYITLDFDSSWEGFTRHVTIEGSGVKTTLGVSDRVSVAKELIEYPNVRVKVGITGVSKDGSQVIPTMWAELGTTRPGAPTDLDGGTPDSGQESPIWAQIIGMIGDLNALDTEDKSNLVAAVNEVMRNGGGGAGGYYTPIVTQTTANTMQIAFAPSVATMPAVEPVTVNLPGSNSGQNPTGGGLSVTAVNLLITILQNGIFATNQTGNIAALREALLAGGSGGGDTPDVPDVPDTPEEPDEPVVADDITVADGVMTIVSVGSEITVSDGVMTIA